MIPALSALCERYGLRATVRRRDDGVTVTLRRDDGSLVGMCGGATVEAATAAHAVILDGEPPRGAIVDAPSHHALAGVAYRTKRVGYAGQDVSAYVDAGLRDPHGRAVRVWVTAVETLGPRDLDGVEAQVLVALRDGSAGGLHHIGTVRDVRRALDELEACGLAVMDDGRWCVTARGKMIAEEMGR